MILPYPEYPQLKPALRRALEEGFQLSVSDIGFTDTMYQDPCGSGEFPHSRWNVEIDISGQVTNKTRLALPILSSSMPGVTNACVARILASSGGLPVLPRDLSFEDIEKMIYEIRQDVPEKGNRKLPILDAQGRLRVAAAVGVMPRSGLDPAVRVDGFVKLGVEIIFIEMQQANSKLGFDFCRYLRSKYRSLEIVMGNFNSADGVRRAVECGADGVKIGIGSGDACLTSPMSGITKGQVNAVFEIAALFQNVRKVPIIVDGGTNTPGGAALLLSVIDGFGAIMLGSKIAATEESALLNKSFRAVQKAACVRVEGHGSESSERAKKASPEQWILEGKVISCSISGSLNQLLQKYEGGFRTAMFGYHGAKNWHELNRKAVIALNSPANAYERWIRHGDSF